MTEEINIFKVHNRDSGTSEELKKLISKSNHMII